MVPDGLWQHPELQPLDIKVWCALMHHARDRTSVDSTNRSIAGTAGTSLATLKRSLSRLTGTGFVRVSGTSNDRVVELCPDAVEAVYSLRIAN